MANATSEELDEREAAMRALRGDNAALSSAIALLHEIGNLVRATQELEPTCYALLTGIVSKSGLDMGRAAIFLVGESGPLHGLAAVGPMDREEAARMDGGPELETLYEVGLSRAARPDPFDRIVRAMTIDPRGQSPLAIALRRGRLVAGEGTDDLGGLLELPTTIVAPLRGRARIRGVLVADSRFRSTPLGPALRLVFDLLADQAGRAVENAEHFDRLARETETDPLTGLGNRRSFDTRLRELVASALAGDGPPFGLLLIDVDDLQRVNDAHGKLAGDRVMAEIGRRMLGTLRPGEGFRYGDDELAVLLAGVGHDGLVGAGDRIHKAIASRPFDVKGPMRLGVSLGGALLPGRAEDGPGLVRAADEAMRRAKSDGKNRIRIA